MSTNIGLIGGTGDIGSALAVHFAKKFDLVLIGSRSKEKAENSVKDIIKDKIKNTDIRDHLRPETNETVVETCDELVLTVPYLAAIDTVRNLLQKFRQGQLLISAVAAIKKTRREFVAIQDVSSVAKTIQDLLPKVKVAAAFQTLPAHILYNEREIDADVFVSCNEPETYLRTAQIVSCVSGVRPLYVGSLELSSEIEGLTALLLNISESARLKHPTFKIHSF